MKNCNKGKCLLSVIAVFVFTMLFDFVVHGKLLTSVYMVSASAFRPQEQMQQMMTECLAFHFLMSVVLVAMFKNYKNYSAEACAADPELAKKCKPCARGMCFGVMIGLITGLGMASTYIWFPVSGELAVAWFFSGLFKGIGIGLVLGALSSNKNCEVEVKEVKKKKSKK